MLAVRSDLRENKIPNRLILWGMIIGIGIRLTESVMRKNLSDMLILIPEVLFLFFCLWPVYQIDGLGAGDVKLLLMTGMFLPVKQALFIIITAFFAAAVLGGFKILTGKAWKRKRKIRFTPPLLLAVFLYLGIFLAKRL